MFIMFKKYRISFVDKIGETGFKTSIYKGSSKVGKAWREDGKVGIDDIQFELTQAAKQELAVMTRAKKRLMIDGVEQAWSTPLIVYSMMENKSIYENLKKALQSNRLVVQFKGDDFFSVLSGLRNTPKDLAILKKEMKRDVAMKAEDLIRIYDENRHD